MNKIDRIIAAVSLIVMFIVICYLIVLYDQSKQTIFYLNKDILYLKEENEALKNRLNEKQYYYNNKQEDVIKTIVTAYTPSENETDDTPYTTAFLKNVHPKYIAVSRPIIEKLKWKPGDKVYIDGIGIRIIGDLMNKRFSDYRIDLFMWKKEDALKWGIKTDVTAIRLARNF